MKRLSVLSIITILLMLTSIVLTFIISKADLYISFIEDNIDDITTKINFFQFNDLRAYNSNTALLVLDALDKKNGYIRSNKVLNSNLHEFEKDKLIQIGEQLYTPSLQEQLKRKSKRYLISKLDSIDPNIRSMDKQNWSKRKLIIRLATYYPIPLSQKQFRYLDSLYVCDWNEYIKESSKIYSRYDGYYLNWSYEKNRMKGKRSKLINFLTIIQVLALFTTFYDTKFIESSKHLFNETINRKRQKKR